MLGVPVVPGVEMGPTTCNECALTPVPSPWLPELLIIISLSSRTETTPSMALPWFEEQAEGKYRAVSLLRVIGKILLVRAVLCERWDSCLLGGFLVRVCEIVYFLITIYI